MDRLQAMHLFVRVAELNSFSAVAQQLGVARSVVTRQIAGLEQHLGLKLMARSTRRLTLTSAGAAYLEKCRVILNLVEAAETGIAEERQIPRGHVRISLPLSFGLMRVVPLLLDFARAYPEVSLEMDYSDRRVNLIEEGVDLAIPLADAATSPDDMVLVPAVPAVMLVVSGDPVEVPGFFIDRHEVRNRDYEEFVDAGGYVEASHWRDLPFEDGDGWHAARKAEAGDCHGHLRAGFRCELFADRLLQLIG